MAPDVRIWPDILYRAEYQIQYPARPDDVWKLWDKISIQASLYSTFLFNSYAAEYPAILISDPSLLNRGAQYWYSASGLTKYPVETIDTRPSDMPENMKSGPSLLNSTQYGYFISGRTDIRKQNYVGSFLMCTFVTEIYLLNWTDIRNILYPV